MRSGYQQLLLPYLYRKFCHCGAGLVDIHCGSPVSFPDLMQHPCGILSIVGGARSACARSRTISTACSSDLQPHPPTCRLLLVLTEFSTGGRRYGGRWPIWLLRLHLWLQWYLWLQLHLWLRLQHHISRPHWTVSGKILPYIVQIIITSNELLKIVAR